MTQQTPLSALNNLKIAHLNIRASGQTLIKPQATILHFARKATDIMCFTEVKISKKNHNYYHHKDYNTYHNLPDNHQEQAPKEGLIILIRKTLCYDHPTITHTPRQGNHHPLQVPKPHTQMLLPIRPVTKRYHLFSFLRRSIRLASTRPNTKHNLYR